jgi:K+-transporting ATPase KdpF subunit
MENIIVGLIALGLFAYLIVAMIRPEKILNSPSYPQCPRSGILQAGRL